MKKIIDIEKIIHRMEDILDDLDILKNYLDINQLDSEFKTVKEIHSKLEGHIKTLKKVNRKFKV